MRIALFTDGVYPYVIGGMQKHSYYLAKYFAQIGVEVDLYHTNKSSYDIDKLAFFSTEEKSKIRSFVIPFPESDKLPGHYIRSSYKYSQLIVELFKNNGPVDFIYAKGFTAWKLIEEKKQGFKCPPIGVNFHGFEMFQKPPSLRSRLESILLLRQPVLFNARNADYLFSYGGGISTIIKSLGIDYRKIIEVPTGIEEKWINQHPGNGNKLVRLLFVGRFERRKGVEELNQVLKQLSQRHSFSFTFVGPIPEAKKVNIPEVNYLGSVSEEDQMRAIMQQHDILVCPSHSEGMPNVIVEAMASGMAIIATDVGAVSEMVSENNGWLIKPNHLNELKEAIIAGITLSDDKLSLLKSASVDLVKNRFLWKHIIKDISSKIEKAIH